MCGIVGIIDLGGKPIDPQILVRMNSAIRHRGRDDEGYLFVNTDSNQFACASGDDSPSVMQNAYPKTHEIASLTLCHIGLAHRRFSIVDLSPGGHQPFFSRDRSCCVVFNGEIYNYLEIRQELTNKGRIFTTASDTEVLVEAYSCWGTDCFQHFNGFWSVAIYDFRQKRLILSRDRMGKKPLYYALHGSRVYFASEIKALLQVDSLAQSMRVNEDAAELWLIHGVRDVTRSTLFDGIYSLPPASWTAVDSNFPNRIQSFWQIPNTRLTEKEIGVAEACTSIRDLLRDAVRIRMRSDVPWSVELSGGMDSSALVALASELSSDRIRTYTVRFPDPKWNEEPFARSVAQHYGVDYQVIDSPLDNFWPQILPFTYLQEEPYHAPNLHTNQVIWTLMRAAGTKVSLNGAAGDELFAGYGGYFYNAQVENWQNRRLVDFVRNAVGWSEERRRGEGVQPCLSGM